MKKILFILIMCCYGSSLSANDSLRVDNLTTRIAQLEHDVNYITCKYEIERDIHSLNENSNSVSNNTTDLKIDIANKRHKKNYILLDAHITCYHSNQKALIQYKEQYILLKRYVEEIISLSNFREDEIRLIKSLLEVYQSSLDKYESGIELYKQTILKYDDTKK